ncbi:MAG TPA: hypothetical protein VE953_25120 [Terriglobales bacterium]|nr:hypothetical protein [Terriglobales bacterium]
MDISLLETRLPPLPADRCPYASGRAGGFERCPTFRSVVGLPGRPPAPGLDVLTHEPGPLTTCAFLAIGLVGAGRFYPRCRLGTPAARRRYARGGRRGPVTSRT